MREELKGLAWKRLSARATDYLLFSLLIDALFGSYLDEQSVLFNALFYLCAIPLLYIPLEAIQIFMYGRTAGKYLSGIFVASKEDVITPLLAIKRSVMVWVYGIGMGLPVFEFVAMYLAYRKLIAKGHTTWDERLLTNVVPGRNGTTIRQ